MNEWKKGWTLDGLVNWELWPSVQILIYHESKSRAHYCKQSSTLSTRSPLQPAFKLLRYLNLSTLDEDSSSTERDHYTSSTSKATFKLDHNPSQVKLYGNLPILSCKFIFLLITSIFCLQTQPSLTSTSTFAFKKQWN